LANRARTALRLSLDWEGTADQAELIDDPVYGAQGR
jgi:hypothetical protein